VNVSVALKCWILVRRYQGDVAFMDAIPDHASSR
jgi:hypothetical protein